MQLKPRVITLPKNGTPNNLYIKKKIDLVRMLHTECIIQALGIRTVSGSVVYVRHVLLLIISVGAMKHVGGFR